MVKVLPVLLKYLRYAYKNNKTPPSRIIFIVGINNVKMVDWTDTQIRILIDERRNRNEDFGRNRIRFWDSIATRINQDHNTNFNGHQCKEKFMNLVRDYNVSMVY